MFENGILSNSVFLNLNTHLYTHNPYLQGLIPFYSYLNSSIDKNSVINFFFKSITTSFGINGFFEVHGEYILSNYLIKENDVRIEVNIIKDLLFNPKISKFVFGWYVLIIKNIKTKELIKEYRSLLNNISDHIDINGIMIMLQEYYNRNNEVEIYELFKQIIQ